MEVTISDKDIAKGIIEKGLQKEYEDQLNKYSHILKEWEANPRENKAMFHKLYRKMIKHDKHMLQRYAKVTDSKLLLVIAAQLVDGIITKEDIEHLSEEAKSEIKRIISL